MSSQKQLKEVSWNLYHLKGSDDRHTHKWEKLPPHFSKDEKYIVQGQQLSLHDFLLSDLWYKYHLSTITIRHSVIFHLWLPFERERTRLNTHLPVVSDKLVVRLCKGLPTFSDSVDSSYVLPVVTYVSRDTQYL